MNIDRHGRNIELLYDGNQVVPAPIFDNGRCLTAECGNRLENILKWNYQEGGMGNTFVGGIYLEHNLNYISKSYRLPSLSEETYKHIFYGLGNVLESQHIAILKESIEYRYNKLKDRGILL